MELEKILELLSFLKQQKKLPKKYLWMLIKKTKQILYREQNVEFVDLDESKEIIICGDIHG